METPTLTREQIEQAKQDTSHPVVQLLYGMDDFIKDYNERYKATKDSPHDFIGKNIGPLAEKLNAFEDFPMGPLDMVSIWSKVCKDFTTYNKYNLSATIPAIYATRKIPSPEWKGLANQVATVNRSKIPEKLLADEKNAFEYFSRLKAVNGNIKEIYLYTHGTRESLTDLFRGLQNRDPEKIEEIERVDKWYKEHEDPVLNEIHENFGNGFSLLFVNMPDEIRNKLYAKK